MYGEVAVLDLVAKQGRSFASERCQLFAVLASRSKIILQEI